MMRLAAVLLGAGLWVLTGPAAVAEELPEVTRNMAELAFLEGRLDDLDEILAGADDPAMYIPLAARDFVFRRSSRDEIVRVGWFHDGFLQDDAVGDHYRWMLNAPPRGPYPLRQNDPWPIVSALLRDYETRIAEGSRDLPQQSALAQVGPRTRRIDWFRDHERNLMSVTYRGPPPHPELVQKRAEAEELVRRNTLLAAAAMVLLLLVPLAIGRRLGPPPDSAPGPVRSTPNAT